ncbi:hypothetical protein ACFQDG_14795 [Natronoarchaeum mannanilyticum]|uniref:Uncharacterized protein n=1 Tax=Natronoarchaeum mannanilyticum TaxID=926360 RepID=A0AAV3T7H9_9EURY
MDFTEQELQDRYDKDNYALRFHRDDLESQLRRKDALDLVSKHKTVWHRESAKGATELHLGRYERSRECFAEGTAFKTAYLHIVETAHRRGERLGGDWNAYLQNAEETLETAILGSDPVLEARVVEQARQYTDEDATKPHFEYWHNRVHALAALVDGTDDRALERLDAAAEHLEVVGFATAEPALDLYRGLAVADEAAIEDAAADLAAIAEREFEPTVAHGGQLVSFHAIAGLALARRRGLDVAVESNAIPEEVCRHDWAHREHDLSELARTTLAAVDADKCE